jgi:hypothetical protein
MLANLVVVLHLAFVVFVVAGGLLVLWRRWVAWLHLPAAAWGVWISAAGWICPLTPLENWLRVRAGQSAYVEDFTSRYLLPVLYPAGLTHDHQIVLAVFVTAVNVLVYATVWRRGHGRPGVPAGRA